MTTRFIDAFKVLGWAKETDAGTARTLAEMHQNIRFYNVKCSPEVEEYKRKYADGQFAALESIKGKCKASITASVDFDWGGSLNSWPHWFELFSICGFGMYQHTTGNTAITNESVGTGNGVLTTFTHAAAHNKIKKGTIVLSVNGVDVGADDGYGNIYATSGTVLHGTINYGTGALSVTFAVAVVNTQAIVFDYAYATTITGNSALDSRDFGNQTGTFIYQETQEGASPRGLCIQVAGAMAKLKIIGDAVGKCVRLDLTIEGKLGDIFMTNTPMSPITADFDDVLPEAQLQVAMTLFGDSVEVDKWEIDTGATITLETKMGDVSGYNHSHIVGFDPMFKCDPYLHTLSGDGTSQDWYSKWRTAGSLGAIVIEIGDHMTITAPLLQLKTAYKLGERNKISSNPLEFIFTKDTSTDKGHGLRVLQGTLV